MGSPTRHRRAHLHSNPLVVTTLSTSSANKEAKGQTQLDCFFGSCDGSYIRISDASSVDLFDCVELEGFNGGHMNERTNQMKSGRLEFGFTLGSMHLYSNAQIKGLAFIQK